MTTEVYDPGSDPKPLGVSGGFCSADTCSKERFCDLFSLTTGAVLGGARCEGEDGWIEGAEYDSARDPKPFAREGDTVMDRGGGSMTNARGFFSSCVLTPYN